MTCFTAANSTCYEKYDEWKNFEESREYCTGRNMTLARVYSQADLDEINNIV